MSEVERADRGSKSDLLVVDACVLINLYSTSRVDDILAAQPETVGVVNEVLAESLYVMSRDSDEPQPVDTSGQEASGLLLRLQLTAAETEAYVHHAVVLDDGEAATVALAAARSARMVTDDRAAIAYVRREASHVPVLRTSHLLEQWSVASGASPEQVRDLVRDIRDLGRFVPGPADPLVTWWMPFLTDLAPG